MPLFFKAKMRKKVVFASSFTFKHAKVHVIGGTYLECRLALTECPLEGHWDGDVVPHRGSYHDYLHFADIET